MKLFTAFSALALIAAGCSSSDSKDSSSGGPTTITNPDGGVSVAGLDVPIPEGIWTKTTNIAHYKVYATRDDAIAWFNGAKSGDPDIANDTVVAASDPRYAEIDTEVGQIWTGFQQLFPRDTADLPAPIVLLTNPQSNLPGAYAVYDDGLGLSPNVFMIQTPTLPLGTVSLRGVIAHELTHHVLKHKWPGVADKIERWYDASKAGADFGFDQTNDTTIANTGNAYVAYATITGDYPLTQWNGWNRPGSAFDYYRDLIHRTAASKNAGPCTDSDNARGTLIDFVNPLRDQATGVFAASPDQLAQMSGLTTDAVAKEETCTSVVTGTLFDVVAADQGISAAQVRTNASPDQIAANDAASSPYDAIVRLTKNDDAKLVAIDAKNLRHYTFEEQADDMSQVVLYALKEDVHGIIVYLQNGALTDSAGSLTNAQKAECASYGTNEPPYGILSDEHHGTCWRIWHSTNLANAKLSK